MKNFSIKLTVNGEPTYVEWSDLMKSLQSSKRKGLPLSIQEILYNSDFKDLPVNTYVPDTDCRYIYSGDILVIPVIDVTIDPEDTFKGISIVNVEAEVIYQYGAFVCVIKGEFVPLYDIVNYNYSDDNLPDYFYSKSYEEYSVDRDYLIERYALEDAEDLFDKLNTITVKG